MGILFALLALASWGVGDFLIQRSARKFGDGIALFFITAFATIVLLPFIYPDLLILLANRSDFILLLLAGAVVLFAALFDFEALRVGKISVVEPILALEIPITAALAVIVLREQLTLLQTALIIILILGIFLVSTKSLAHLKRISLERGVIYALLGALAMGTVNFMFAVGARETTPLLINWFTSAFVALVLLVYLIANSRVKEVLADFKRSPALVLGVSFIDNLAWVAFAFSVLTLPVAIVTGITESYVALAALLGFIFNQERLRAHQWLGFGVALVAVIVLTIITS